MQQPQPQQRFIPPTLHSNRCWSSTNQQSQRSFLHSLLADTIFSTITKPHKEWKPATTATTITSTTQGRTEQEQALLTLPTERLGTKYRNLLKSYNTDIQVFTHPLHGHYLTAYFHCTKQRRPLPTNLELHRIPVRCSCWCPSVDGWCSEAASWEGGACFP